MNERREQQNVLRSVAEHVRHITSEIPTYAYRLKELIRRDKSNCLLNAGIILSYGMAVVVAPDNLRPRLLLAPIIASILAVPCAALTVRYAAAIARQDLQKIERENAEDIERNDILPGIQP